MREKIGKHGRWRRRWTDEVEEEMEVKEVAVEEEMGIRGSNHTPVTGHRSPAAPPPPSCSCSAVIFTVFKRDSASAP
jgi:hypothetical protein